MSSDARLKPQITADTIECAGLSAAVVVRRDERGIPFIEATNESDLYFAQGYATASDRLWQMDFLRRTARGRLAEILGAAALEVDKLHRVYGFGRVAEKLLARASDHARRAIESYARGVNTFIAQCEATSLPLEFQVLQYRPNPWTAVDSIALGKLFAEKLSFTVDVDILRALLSDLPPERLAWLLPETSPLDLVEDRESQTKRVFASREFSENERVMLTGVLKALRRARAATSGDSEVGSNSWVVSGAKTVSGKPLLASDPHLPPTSPSIWHIIHLGAGHLRVAGVAVPGVPGVMLGHNESIAWGVTNLCPDVQDLYIEQLDPANPRSYKTPAGWRDAEVRTEEIAVRGAAPLKLEVKATRHGPVIFETGSTALALRWTALAADIIDLETFLALNRARNWDDFVSALSNYGGPPQNFTYADTAGHIGYYTAGRIPIRKTGDGSVPYDGTTDDGEWLGYIPFVELPHVFDPPSGTVVQANQRIVNTDYKHHITSNWRVPYRARRIHELLQTRPKVDAEDFLAIQGDTYSYPDALFASELLKLGEPTELREILRDWDGHSRAESTVLPLLVEMRKAFRDRLLTAAIGTERAELYEWRNEGTLIDRLITERPNEWLPADFESYEQLLLTCYRDAQTKLTNKLGPDRAQWTWGRLAQIRFPHPLEKLSAKFASPTLLQHTDGSMPTVNAGSRVSLRFIADLSDWDATRLCLPLGESGSSTSAHRTDQLDEWCNVAPRRVPFGDAAIANSTRSALLLAPQGNSK